MIRQEIINLIKVAIGDSGFESAEAAVGHPENAEFGDYATSIALQIAKTTGMRPKEMAEIIKSKISVPLSGTAAGKQILFEKIEVAEPGFINFFISKEYLQSQVGEILRQKEKFGQLKIGKDKRVNIESISANPTGQLHIGNGRNAFAGEALANVLEKSGHKVTREYFINDAKNSNQIKELGKTALGRGTTYLTKNLEFRISNLESELKKITDEGEAGFLLAQEIQKGTRDFLEKKLKIKFDKWVSEEFDIYKNNKINKILDWLKEKNFVYQKDGAWWVKTSQFGDEKDWVVIRETGEPTYLLSDIAYHKDKFDRGFDKVIDIWGADHQAHVSKMKAVAKMLAFPGDLDILVLQLVTLRGGEKMSKRAGNVITLEELVDEIGPDVARWFYLQKSLDTHTEIDLTLAKEQSEKNPVFYVQYAHARICSILSKFGKFPAFAKASAGKANLKLLDHPSELNLIKQLIKFPEVVEDTANDYQIQRLPQYAMNLAASFHQFYRDCKVLSGPSIGSGSSRAKSRDEVEGLQAARLALAAAAKIVLKNTLFLMGISAPEKM